MGSLIYELQTLKDVSRADIVIYTCPSKERTEEIFTILHSNMKLNKLRLWMNAPYKYPIQHIKQLISANKRLDELNICIHTDSEQEIDDIVDLLAWNISISEVTLFGRISIKIMARLIRINHTIEKITIYEPLNCFEELESILKAMMVNDTIKKIVVHGDNLPTPNDLMLKHIPSIKVLKRLHMINYEQPSLAMWVKFSRLDKEKGVDLSDNRPIYRFSDGNSEYVEKEHSR